MREDPRLARSRRALVDAATDLLDRSSDDTITVTDLVAAAGVSRPTFYEHYGDIPTLLRAAALDRLQQTFARVSPPDSIEAWAETAPTTIRALLTGLGEHSSFYLRVLAGPSGHDFMASVIEFLTTRFLDVSPIGGALRSVDEDAAAERSAFLAAGTTWLMVRWLHSDFRGNDSIDATTARTSELLLSAAGLARPGGSTSKEDRR